MVKQIEFIVGHYVLLEGDYVCQLSILHSSHFHFLVALLHQLDFVFGLGQLIARIFFFWSEFIAVAEEGGCFLNLCKRLLVLAIIVIIINGKGLLNHS